MTKPKRLDGKTKNFKLTAKMEKDLKAYCKSKGIRHESVLIREAIAAYIYAPFDNQNLKPYSIDDLYAKVDKLQNTFERVFKTE
jgi:hypothetical protein